MKRFLIAAMLLLCAGLPARGQFTTVSATVQDPNGNVYINCSGSASFVPATNATQVPTLSGSTFQTDLPISSCDSFGAFSLVLADNAQVSDGHSGGTASQWRITICSSTTPKVCFPTTLTITGATQNISAALKAAAAPLPGTVGLINASGGITSGKSYRDCRLDGMKADGVSDDSATFQICWNNAVAAGQGTLIIPCGTVEILTSQNFTNKPGMTINGCGSQRCRFTGSCGTNYITLPNTTVIDLRTGTIPGLDFTGSGSTTLSNLTLNTCAAGTTCSAPLANASTIAMLFGRDLAGGGTPYFDFAQWITLVNVQVQMAHSASANANFGSIGIYNAGAEQFSLVNSSIYADTPAWFTLTNSTLGVTSAYQTLGSAVSMNGVSIISSDLWYTSGTGAGLVVEGGISTVKIDRPSGIHSLTAHSITSPAILSLGTSADYDWQLSAQIEDVTSSGSNGAIINTNHSLDHFNVDIALAGYTGSGSPAGLIQWNGQTGLTLSNSVIRAKNINGTAVPLIQNTANTVSGSLLDLSSSLNPASFSNLTLADDDIWAIGFADANLTFAGGAKYTLHDDTGVSEASGKTTKQINRMRANQGTALAVTDFALGGNWGTSPSVSAALGTDSLFLATVLSGGGAPGANPTITITFKDGTWGSQPICVPSRNDINAPVAATWSVDRASSSATAVAFTFVGTPNTATSYNLVASCSGK
jgi:hypothetical protein